MKIVRFNGEATFGCPFSIAVAELASLWTYSTLAKIYFRLSIAQLYLQLWQSLFPQQTTHKQSNWPIPPAGKILL